MSLHILIILLLLNIALIFTNLQDNDYILALYFCGVAIVHVALILLKLKGV